MKIGLIWPVCSQSSVGRDPLKKYFHFYNENIHVFHLPVLVRKKIITILVAEIRKKKSERLKEAIFRTALCYQLYMSMESVKVYFLTYRIETEVDITSQSF